jgi:RNA polymerase-binding transcription factor DksA
LRADLLGETSEELAPSDQHQADVGTETFEREKDLSVLAELTARLRDIEEELDRRD